MMHPSLSPLELKQALEDSQRPLLLDVRLTDDYQASHLPGAINNPVYEVSFHERLATQCPDLHQAVCVYGSDIYSHEARMAAEKLLRKGYRKVYELRQGIQGWEACGLATEGTGNYPAKGQTLEDGLHHLDLASCRVGWKGRNLLNQHEGTLPLVDGHLEFAKGQLQGGFFVLDMNGIQCGDLSEDQGRALLVRHLKDHDFFDVGRYPQARFDITKAKHKKQATPGSPNLVIHGQLNLKGVTRPVTFEATSGITPEGKAAAQAQLSIDRTEWGVIYGSGKFFHRLAKHLVNDQIELDLLIVTR